MSGPSVVCLGEAMVELSLRDAEARTADLGFAGDTLNTAIYLKRASLSARVAYATKLGRDELSDRMIGFMASEGLDTSLIERSANATPGLYAISTDARGERSFSYWRSASAARQMFAPPEVSLSAISGFDLFYFSAISLAILPQDHRSMLINWLPAFRAGGGRVAFDSNYRPALWPDAATARRDIAGAWRQTDIALPSLDDEQALFGERQLDETLARLEGYGVRSGALKRGAQGPLALDGTPCSGFFAAAKVVDSTAAGDSFNAAYLAARLANQPEAECLHAGHNLAARVIGARGAIIPRDGMAEQ